VYAGALRIPSPIGPHPSDLSKFMNAKDPNALNPWLGTYTDEEDSRSFVR